jgi:hypothetical protein
VGDVDAFIDVNHYTKEEKARIIASYPPFEVEARTKGVTRQRPYFPVAEGMIGTHWWHGPAGITRSRRSSLCGIATPTAFTSARPYRCRESTPIMHAAALRPWGKDLRWAWPRDGRRETLEGVGISQRFIPIPIERFDRARALEAAIADAWSSLDSSESIKPHPNPFNELFLTHWNPKEVAPALVT